MRVIETEFPGVVEIVPRRIADERGWFIEAWNASAFADAGLKFDWVQDNESLSLQAGTVRGIHFQASPYAQDKLVRVIAGRIFDVAVDLRRSSPTFGRWTGRLLDAERGNQMVIPKGFGHAFATLEPDCLIAYKVTAHYNQSADRAIAWDDPDIGIAWPVDTSAVSMSDKDRTAPRLQDLTAELFD